jgi:hypothetical protein
LSLYQHTDRYSISLLIACQSKFPSVLFFLALPQKESKNSSQLNPSARESQNFRLSRKAMIVAHFGFPPSAGPESGQGLRAFHIANFF